MRRHSTVNMTGLIITFSLLALTPALVVGQPALARPADLYVDAAATENGDGSREYPFWRITDGVVAARALRQHHHHDDITLHVLPGTYVGSYDPDHLASDARLELLPIILNVSDLRLEGGTELDKDVDGLPTGTYPLESETLLTTDLILSRGQMLLLIATTTDGMAGNRVSVSGFVTDAQGQTSVDVPGFDIYADRVLDFSIHHNLLRHGTSGVGTRLASGGVQRNFFTASNQGPGNFITGGSRAHPANVALRQNRTTQSPGGTTVAALANFLDLQLGANPSVYMLTLEPLQTIYDINNPEDARNTPDKLEVIIEDNDFSGNNFGLRCMFYPPFYYTTLDATQPITGTLNVTVRDNRLNRNTDHGLDVDAGFAYRSEPRQLSGTFEGTFERNAFIGNGRNASLFDFTDKRVSLAGQPPDVSKYMQETILEVTDLDGELEGFDYDHPLKDPFDGSPVVGNTLIYNGEVQPNGIQITPRP